MTDPLLLVGDVGGTNARFALTRMVNGRPRLEHFESFPAETHPTFLDGVKAYLDGCPVKPTGGVIAVAGPVTDGAIDLTNSPWRVSEGELQTLGLNPIRLINDFEALAWGAPVVPEDELASLGGPAQGDPHAAIALVGPGTGFGVSALARDAHGREMALPSEGGHACFAPGDEVEDEVLRILRRRYDRVSIERLICGPGLLNLHRALAEIDGRETHIDDPAQITAQALEDPTSPCGATLARFCAMLGAVAGDIALTTGARGGVYIAGGIAPRILPFIQASPFRRRFERKGRFQDYMAAIPTKVILHKHAALLGAARVAFAEAG
ncbi:Glucokinase [Brevundimonas diminuta]|uniref:glucokinase n=1 Tax=Brevundimonas diminuta TaxID=293 RepID=UPI000207F563|nr:glucokinase [Brevundimonas diminuta]EGF95666.1 glucokinase [Brevundimonas diminuta ATCC 11568]OWR19291.1 glucokinase [Brevundimonas diminuta]WQE45533.1 glucokinase [Brevundimonas diminuta]SPU44561.1 Glucokinase [Brevundimonas diminuta]SUW14744.1 Glucokinase [Brevundimonas diminuta]